MTIRIMIADDHRLVREGLRMFLGRDPRVRDRRRSGRRSRGGRASSCTATDVVLMDLLMPVMDGIAVTSAIRSALPEAEVLALTSVLAAASVVRAIRAGAIGYLLKDTQAAELRKAIKAAADHQVQLSPQASTYLLRELQVTEHPEALTEHEMDVLHLLAQGRSNKEIAHTPHLVEDTVKTHVRHILAKLGVQSRTQAVLYAIRSELISPEQGKILKCQHRCTPAYQGGKGDHPGGARQRKRL